MNPKLAPRIILPKSEPGSSSESPSAENSTVVGVESAAKRKCISSACMPCRRRKSKCDGATPSCSACISVYSSSCHYDIDSDHRRKGALKRDIAQLKEELGSQNLILDAIRKGSESDVDDIIQLVRANPDESYDSVAESIQRMILANKRTEAASVLEGALADFSVQPVLDKTGENRYYGHTSNLAVLENDEDIPPIHTEQVGSWTEVTHDTELINHLLDVYFSWSHPFYMMFSEEVFYYGMNERKLKYCSPLLVNAILAVGCYFSERPEARANPDDPLTVGHHFFTEARRLFQLDDRSCLTTIQALGLMSIHQVMGNADSRGWVFAGQMMSMSIQLGLHLSYPAEPNGKITPTEIEARRVTFWGCFGLQTVWSIGVGRISWLPREAIRLEKPGVIERFDSRPWKPHDLSRDPELEQRSSKYSLFLQLSLMSEIVDDIIHMFYAPKDRITSRKLQQQYVTLQAWYRNLPESLLLRNDGPTTPQVLSLHIYYNNCLIHLFRPFLKVQFVQNAKSPRQICTESAINISRIISLYTQTYGFRKIVLINTHCIMSAAIIHIVNLSGNSSATELHEIYLAEGITTLYKMQLRCPLAHRYLKTTIGLIKKWCPVIPVRVKEALAEIEISSPSSSRTMASSSSQHNVIGITEVNDGTSISSKPTGRTTSDLNFPPNHNQRKDSAPELVLRAPPSSSAMGRNSSTSAAKQIFWTPFPDNFDGVPLAPPDGGMAQHMDISSLLDSGVDGDWPQLNRDGFTLGSQDAESALLGVNWSAPV